MLNWRSKRDPAPGPLRSPSGPPGKVCFAIGDTHGRLDLLEDLLGRIETDCRGMRGVETHVVLLGDLIDRGPDSRGVLELARHGLDFADLHLIKGNHEAMMIEALTGAPSRLQTWLDKGGYACVKSYGVDVGSLFGRPEAQMQDILLRHIPMRDIAFVDGFLDSIRFGDYFLTHAGVRPGVALDKQRPQDLHWIRSPFLESEADHGALIVHGHSVRMSVEEKSNRIGIDTGAWKTGVLTALRIEGQERRLLQTAGAPVTEPA